MRLGKWGKILHHDCVALGKGTIDRYTFFEWKPLGAIILNVFNSTEQDRFHTHAFNSLSVMLRGSYLEEMKQADGSITRLRHGDVVYLPRTLEHRILGSTPNALSITFCGPWEDTWTETFPNGKKRTLEWGRKSRMTEEKELRDAAKALWTNVIQLSPIASPEVRIKADKETDKILSRVLKAIADFDKKHGATHR